MRGGEPPKRTVRTLGPDTARKAAKTQPKSGRRLPLVAMLIGAVALVVLGTILIQNLGDNDTALASECWTGEPTTNGGQMQWSAAPEQVVDPARTYTATIETTAGSIVVTLDPERAPVTVNNFVCLARAGYYDNTPFHRIIRDFMIQGGDPTGTGTGGPGYQFADELPEGDMPYVRGTVAMANAGPNTNGSQFFIVHQDQPAAFPKSYSIFGQVTQGLEVVDALAAMPVADNGLGEVSAPTGDVRIVRVTIAEQ